MLQAIAFLLPHLLLLLVDARIWPILPVQFAVGWLVGWLRHQSQSILPGRLAHSISNVLGVVMVQW